MNLSKITAPLCSHRLKRAGRALVILSGIVFSSCTKSAYVYQQFEVHTPAKASAIAATSPPHLIYEETVTVEFVVDAAGAATDVRAVDESPSDFSVAGTDKTVHPGFAAAAVEAVFAADYSAATVDGAPVPQHMRVQIVFNKGAPVDSRPEIKSMAPPDYPEMLRETGVEGTVRVEALIGPSGAVEEARIFDSTNHRLNTVCLEAAKRALFAPARKDGRAIAYWVVIPYRFWLP